MKVNERVCDECALNSNSVVGEDLRTLICRASEIGLTFPCHWPEFRDGDCIDKVRSMMAYRRSPYCWAGLALLRAAWEAGAFPGDLHRQVGEIIESAEFVPCHSRETMQKIANDKGEIITISTSVSFGVLDIPGKKIIVRPSR